MRTRSLKVGPRIAIVEGLNIFVVAFAEAIDSEELERPPAAFRTFDRESLSVFKYDRSSLTCF